MANDVFWSTIYLGNFADIDTDESDFSTEDENSLLGTYGGPSDQLFNYITNIDTDSPTDNIDVDSVGTNGTLTYDVGGGTTTQRLDSLVDYRGTITFTNGKIATNQLIEVLQTQNGDVFVYVSDSNTIMGRQAIESFEITSVENDTYPAILQSVADDVEFVCFATGTLILTPQGERAVETLAVGDIVETRDHGPQPLIWIASRELRFPQSPDSQKPILFMQGSLGDGLPARDLIVSPQHRMLISGGDVKQINNAPEAFAAAKSHLAMKGVRIMKGRRAVTYHSLMLPTHSVIIAEGTPVESFYPGKVALRCLDPIQRQRLSIAVPGVFIDARAAFGPLARPALTVQQAKAIISKRQRRVGPPKISPQHLRSSPRPPHPTLSDQQGHGSVRAA